MSHFRLCELPKPFIVTVQGDILLFLKVTTKSKKSFIGTVKWGCSFPQSQTCLTIAIAASPTKGKANQELIRFLSNQLNISSSHIKILLGQTRWQKMIQIKTIKPEFLCEVLNLSR